MSSQLHSVDQDQKTTPEYNEQDSDNSSDEESEEDLLDTGSSTISQMCQKLVDSKKLLQEYKEVHEKIFKNLKMLNESVRDARRDVIEYMKENDISSYTDEETGLFFSTQKRAYCSYTKKNLAESLGQEAIEAHKRKFAKERDVIVVKRTKK
jgi:ribosomal protein L16 Arg81 hydroxylase